MLPFVMRVLNRAIAFATSLTEKPNFDLLKRLLTAADWTVPVLSLSVRSSYKPSDEVGELDGSMYEEEQDRTKYRRESCLLSHKTWPVSSDEGGGCITVTAEKTKKKSAQKRDFGKK